jgi:hypothetical protein
VIKLLPKYQIKYANHRPLWAVRTALVVARPWFAYRQGLAQ